jgi:hypothetical protein
MIRTIPLLVVIALITNCDKLSAQIKPVNNKTPPFDGIYYSSKGNTGYLGLLDSAYKYVKIN